MVAKISVSEFIKTISSGAVINSPYDFTTSIGDYSVELSGQKTGFGEKKFFLCPSCGSRRVDLYIYKGELLCRKCLPVRLYKGITDVTPGGYSYVLYKMQRLMEKNNLIDMGFPFDYVQYIDQHRPYQHWDGFLFVLKQLQALENIRCRVLFIGLVKKEVVDEVYKGTHSLLETERLEDLKKYAYEW